MTFEKKLQALQKWASTNRTQCSRSNDHTQADNFEMVNTLIELVRTSRALTIKHENEIKHLEAKVACLESTVFEK